MKYRYYLILLINLLILFWVIREAYYTVPDDTYGIFVIGMFFITLLYDICGFLIAKFFFKNKPLNILIELSYIILVLVPVIAPFLSKRIGEFIAQGFLYIVVFLFAR